MPKDINLIVLCNISKTRKRVSSDVQTLRSGLKWAQPSFF